MINQHFIHQLMRGVQLLALGMLAAAASAIAQPAAAPERLSSQMNPEEVVARAGEITVTVGDYLEAVKHYFGDREVAAVYDEEYEKQTAESIARSVIERRARLRVLHDLGYDRHSGYLAALKLLQWRHLADMAVESLPPFTEEDLTEADLREAYQRKTVAPVENGISFRLIFFRTLGLDEQEVQAKRDKAEKTLERVKGGEPFFEVMKEVSEVVKQQDAPYWIDENTKGFDPQIHQLLKDMAPDEVSSIIEAKAGLFILWRFPRVQREELKPYDEMMADPAGRRDLMRQALQNREMNRKGWLFEQIKDRYPAGAIETTGVDAMQKLSDSTPVLKVGDETLTLGDLKAALNKSLDKCQVEEINTRVEELSKQMVYVKYAREQGLTDQLEALPAYRRDLDRFQGDYLVFTARGEEPDMDEEAMQAFYDGNREAFREMCRANARQIHVKPAKAEAGQKAVLELVVRDEALRLKDLIEQGRTFEQVAGEYGDDRFEINLKRWDDQTPGQIVFADRKYGSNLLDSFGQMLGPERVMDGFVIYSLTEELPGKIIPFEQVKGQINQINKKEKAGEKLNAVYQKHLAGLQLTDELLFIPADLKPRRGK